jgi:hypothetical protein
MSVSGSKAEVTTREVQVCFAPEQRTLRNAAGMSDKYQTRKCLNGLHNLISRLPL